MTDHHASHPQSVAIIGCGFTGTSLLYQLIDRYPVKSVVVFEATGRFGPGYAYDPAQPDTYLINNTTDTMCLTPDNRGAFLAWLRSRPETATIDPAGHLPRHVYGAFLEDVVRTARTMAAIKGVSLRFVPAEVTAMREDDDGRVTVSWAGDAVTCDLAILATGRCPEARTGLDDLGTAQVISTHMPGNNLASVPPAATVHVLGASLSAYDVINALFSPDSGCRFVRDAHGEVNVDAGSNQRRVILASRTGRLKKVGSRTRGPIHRRHLTEANYVALADSGRLTLAAVLDLVRAEAAEHSRAIDWARILAPYAGCSATADVTVRAAEILALDLAAARAGPSGANFLVDLAADAPATIWSAFAKGLLPIDEELAYRRDYESTVLTWTAPCPIPTAERVLALLRAGRVEVRRGTGSPRQAPDGSTWLPHADGEDRVDWLIDTTGRVDRTVDSTAQPALVRTLAAHGVLQPHQREGVSLPGAAVDLATFRAAGARNILVANMLLWGPGFFTSSAFLMATIARQLLEAAFNRTPTHT